MTIRGTSAAALLLCCAGLAACGGGVSKEDYAADLDEVCVDIEEKTEEIGQAEVSNPNELSAQLDDIRTAIEDGIARMKDIERPDGEDGETAEEYVSKLEQTLNQEVLPALDDLEKAVLAKDQDAIRAAATRLQGIDEEETDRLAAELGADECAAE
jgi:bisphosphoglycerate-dependent phosphoglycerate mutase